MYVRMYVRTYVRVCICVYVCECMFMCVGTLVCAFVYMFLCLNNIQVCLSWISAMSDLWVGGKQAIKPNFV